MSKNATGWRESELQQLAAKDMEASRIENLIANIDNNINSIQSPLDIKKLRSLKDYFEKELRKRYDEGLAKSS